MFGRAVVLGSLDAVAGKLDASHGSALRSGSHFLIRESRAFADGELD